MQRAGNPWAVDTWCLACLSIFAIERRLDSVRKCVLFIAYSIEI